MSDKCYNRKRLISEFYKCKNSQKERFIYDSATGSGGFPLYCMKKVSEKIRASYAGNDRLISRKIYDFTKQKIFGIDINAKVARVAMMDMIVNDDGHTNIENNTGFNSAFRNPNIQFGRFTLVMTNPPFGVKIKRDDRDNLGESTFADLVRRIKEIADFRYPLSRAVQEVPI